MKKEQLDRQARIKLLQENFYVMRFMWKHIRGEVGDEMYSESGYNIRRNRYERILNGEPTNIGKSIVRNRSEHFGISNEIYEGNESVLPELKNDKDFFGYFTLRANHNKLRKEYNIKKEEYKNCERELEHKQTHSKSNDNTDKEFEGLLKEYKNAEGRYKTAQQKFDENKEAYRECCKHTGKERPKHEQKIIEQWEKIKADVENRNPNSTYAKKDFFKLCYVLRWNVRPVTVNANDEICKKINALNVILVPETLETCSIDELANISLSIKEIASKAETIYQYSKLKREK